MTCRRKGAYGAALAASGKADGPGITTELVCKALISPFIRRPNNHLRLIKGLLDSHSRPFYGHGLELV